MFRIVEEVGTPLILSKPAVSAPNFSNTDTTKSAFSSSPTAPTASVDKPNFAQSIIVQN